jgi:hypothetical protein
MSSIVGGIIDRQVTTYTTTEPPRNRLLRTSLLVARDHFPLGAGFGRFGSAAAVAPYPYSPVYDDYGFWNVPGLSRDKPDFLRDTSWPAVIGETGFAGWLFYAGGPLALIITMLRRARNFDQDERTQFVALAALVTLVALLFDSAGRPALFDAFTVLSVGLFVGPALAMGSLPRAVPNRDQQDTGDRARVPQVVL